jgi:ATP-binding cassette subfamily B protein
LFADLASAVLIAATAIALPLCANFVTTQVLDAPDGVNVSGSILGVGALMLGLLTLQLLSIYFVDYQGHVMGARIEATVRKQLFDHCQKLSFAYHDHVRVGQLMSRITNDSLWIGELFHHGPEDVAIGLLKMAGALAVLWYIDPMLAAGVAALIPPAIAYALWANGRMYGTLIENKARIAEVNEQVEDALGGIRVVQAFGNEAVESRRFEAANMRYVDSRKASYRAEAFSWIGGQGFAQIVTILVIVLGATRLLSGDLNLAGMLTALLCVGILVDPMERLANFVRLWQEGFTGFTRAMDLLDIEPDILDRSGAVEMAKPRGNVRFDNVTFCYGGNLPPVLDGLSLDIRAGEFVALVGASGVGKSTICALIPRFYEIDAGVVSIDGSDVRDVTLASLRRHIGIVQQDVYLFSGTVAENLRYGRPDASDEDVVAAARAANAHDFIMALPNGYDSDVGQRGVRLSGGQKQRLTIARTFLKDPAILIFDEATSALDNESERAVHDALLTLAKGRTTIVIAHRLSTVRHADRILVLTPDGIGEEGTHEDLMAADGLYATLHREHARI